MHCTLRYPLRIDLNFMISLCENFSQILLMKLEEFNNAKYHSFQVNTHIYSNDDIEVGRGEGFA